MKYATLFALAHVACATATPPPSVLLGALAKRDEYACPGSVHTFCRESAEFEVHESPGADLARRPTFTTLAIEQMDAAFEQQLLFLVRSALEARGYRFVDMANGPGFLVSVTFGRFPTGRVRISGESVATDTGAVSTATASNESVTGVRLVVRAPDSTALWSASAAASPGEAREIFLAQFLVTEGIGKIPWSTWFRTWPTTPLGTRLTVATSDGLSFYPVVTGADDEAKLRTNSLQIDDTIVSVRGVSLRNRTFSEAAGLLAAAVPGEVLQVVRASE